MTKRDELINDFTERWWTSVRTKEQFKDHLRKFADKILELDEGLSEGMTKIESIRHIRNIIKDTSSQHSDLLTAKNIADFIWDNFVENISGRIAKPVCSCDFDNNNMKSGNPNCQIHGEKKEDKLEYTKIKDNWNIVDIEEKLDELVDAVNKINERINGEG